MAAQLKEKIQNGLGEIRILVLGAQVLLGFQFRGVFESGFEKLPSSSQFIHVSALILLIATLGLLMTPTFYHRIVERGEDTEHFHKFAGRMVIAAAIPLALGICGDFFVVARKLTESAAYGATAAGVALAFLYGFWFALPFYRAAKKEAAAH